MKIVFLLLVIVLTGCSSVSDAELKTKIDACNASGMDYTYLMDFRGKPYDVMCVARRLR